MSTIPADNCGRQLRMTIKSIIQVENSIGDNWYENLKYRIDVRMFRWGAKKFVEEEKVLFDRLRLSEINKQPQICQQKIAFCPPTVLLSTSIRFACYPTANVCQLTLLHLSWQSCICHQKLAFYPVKILIFASIRLPYYSTINVFHLTLLHISWQLHICRQKITSCQTEVLFSASFDFACCWTINVFYLTVLYLSWQLHICHQKITYLSSESFTFRYYFLACCSTVSLLSADIQAVSVSRHEHVCQLTWTDNHLVKSSADRHDRHDKHKNPFDMNRHEFSLFSVQTKITIPPQFDIKTDMNRRTFGEKF